MAALAVSLGDPAGIGPEIIVESWARRHDMALAPFFVVGGAGVLAEAAKVRGLAVEIERVPRLGAGADPEAEREALLSTAAVFLSK